MQNYGFKTVKNMSFIKKEKNHEKNNAQTGSDSAGAGSGMLPRCL